MRILIFLLAATHLLVPQTAIAAEIDSITPRSLELDNSISVINDIFNQRISEGIRNANQHMEYIDDHDEFMDIDEDEYCDEETLYTELRRAMFQSLTASWGLKGYDLDRQLRVLLEKQSYSLSLNDSVYRDIDYLEGFSLNLKELSDVVNVNGHLVGLDKIGHFFAEGWDYFEITHFDGQEVERALEWGRLQESGKFGYSTTGIYSFADLAANFNGWRFWNRVLKKQDDPLKSVVANYFLRPYVSCKIQIIASIKNRKIVRAWEANARFDFSGYIDGAWDEGNNCNSYADPFIEQKVTARIKNIDPEFNCPHDAGHCVRARKKYSDYAKYVLHPYCLTAAAR
ncbi:MAG: hypothetical protein JSW45_09660 [Thiotrichales bacterium]|nr:MAG: hypothetical protein JSW45_09660 [Thiotrichales bacterium]